MCSYPYLRFLGCHLEHLQPSLSAYLLSSPSCPTFPSLAAPYPGRPPAQVNQSLLSPRRGDHFSGSGYQRQMHVWSHRQGECLLICRRPALCWRGLNAEAGFRSHEDLEGMICLPEGEASEMPEGESQGCSTPRKLAPLPLTPFVHGFPTVPHFFALAT